jgi:hypothetical protein
VIKNRVIGRSDNKRGQNDLPKADYSKHTGPNIRLTRRRSAVLFGQLPIAICHLLKLLQQILLAGR